MRQMIIFSHRGNNKDMKTQTMIMVALFLLCAFTMILTACNIFPMNIENDLSQSVVRIHIRANSNDEIDQAVKLKVRDEITAYLSDALYNCKDKNEALAIICDNMENLEQIANATLDENGIPDTADARFEIAKKRKKQ